MTKIAASPILHLIRSVVEDQRCRELSDGELLHRFSSGRDEAAFHGLLYRHGPMVLDVCRNVLGNDQDAEDAFQTTFLILALRAGAIQKKASVGSWLYGVAYRSALKAQAAFARRRKHEAARVRLRPPTDARDDFTWREVKQAVHAELNRLSEDYRLPLVLCYLEGKTQDQAAQLMGVSEATVKKRLERGRALLRGRLVRCGLGPAAVLAVSAWPVATASAQLHQTLVSSTVQAAAGFAAGQVGGLVSARVDALTKGVLHTMLWTKFKLAGVALLVLALVVAGAGILMLPAMAQGQKEVPRQKEATASEKPQPIPQKGPANNLVTQETQQAIDAGLAYLAAQQAADGSWGNGQFQGNLAITGLAGRAFLAAGNEPGKGKYGANLTKAIEFLLSQEDQALPGHLVNQAKGAMYSHGFALLFLAEAHGTIADKKLKERVQKLLGRAVKLTLDAQNNEGGWRYTPTPVDVADLTATVCQLQALYAAQKAGVVVPKPALERAVRFVLDCQDLMGDGGFRYLRRNGASGFARSAAALDSLYQAGMARSKEVEKGLDYLRSFQPGLKKVAPGGFYFYAQYYAAQAMWRTGGTDRQKWYPAIRDELLKHPDRQMLKNGAETFWEDQPIGSHFGTAMALIVLQIPHQKLPSLKR